MDSKRSCPDEFAKAGTQRIGLGRSIRVKRQHEAEAEKENVQPQYSKSAVLPSREHKSKLKSQTPTITILQAKCTNISKLLEKHPVSQFITEPKAYHDESWIGQQQHLFTLILNETFESHKVCQTSWEAHRMEDIRKKAFAYYQDPCFRLVGERLAIVSLLIKQIDLYTQGVQN